MQGVWDPACLISVFPHWPGLQQAAPAPCINEIAWVSVKAVSTLGYFLDFEKLQVIQIL